MHADFASAAKAARAQIAVPRADLRSIAERSRRVGVRDRMRAAVVSAAFVLGALGTAAAFAANAGGMRVWLLGDKASVAIDSFAWTYGPTMADLRSIAASASFPVVLPVGFPAGSRMMWVAYSPADHPNIISVQYMDPASHRGMGVLIVDSDDIQESAAALPNAGRITHAAYRWSVGKETVIVGKGLVPDARVRRLKVAMASADAASSLQANAPALAPIPILPRGLGVEYERIANRFALAGGSSVMLLGPALSHIPQLARENKPLPDMRTVYVTHVPASHGEPDYAKATLQWPKTVAISAAGVRAIDAVLRSAKVTPKCRCAILFHTGSRAAYDVWKIELARPHHVSKYAVDRRTFRVIRQ
jgi:hypothetical protein